MQVGFCLNKKVYVLIVIVETSFSFKQLIFYFIYLLITEVLPDINKTYDLEMLLIFYVFSYVLPNI